MATSDSKVIHIEILCPKAQPQRSTTILDELDDVLEDLEAEVHQIAVALFGQDVEMSIHLADEPHEPANIYEP
jgi:hypothetical protein